jgi:hypothetical protein
MLETQLSQVAQHVANSSQSPGIFPGQPETNPKGQINAITFRNGRQLEDPVVETKKNEVEKESNELLGKEVGVESEKPQSEKVVGESEKPKTQPLAKNSFSKKAC